MTGATILTDLLFEFLVKSAVVLALGFAVVALAVRAAPAFRHRIWTSILAASLGLPLLLLLPRWEVLPQLLWEPSPSGIEQPLGEAAPHPLLTEVAPGTPASFDQEELLDRSAAVVATESPVPGSAWISTPRLAFVLWFVGVLVVAGRTMVATIRLWRSRRHSVAPPTSWLTRFEELKKGAGVTKDVALVVSPQFSSPFTWGIVRPQVVLPGGLLKEAMSEDIEMILIHELEHIRRNDTAAVLIARVFIALNWVNPLAWLALRQAGRLREAACDIGVMAAGHNRIQYAELLLRQARVASPSSVDRCATAVAESGTIEQRVKMILNNTSKRVHESTGRHPHFIPALLALSVLTLGTLGVTAGQDDITAKPDGQEGRGKVEEKDEMAVGYRSPGPHATHGVTMAGALTALGVTPDKIDYVKLVGDEASGNSGLSRKMKVDAIFWSRYFETAEPYKFWVASGYRTLEIYLKGEPKPKTTIHINETDSCFVDGDPRKLRYMCRGLHEWFVANLSATATGTTNEGDASEARESETGFFAILSPEVGGGRMLSSGRLGEVICVSEAAVLKPQDLESVKVSGNDGKHTVHVTLKQGARENLQGELKRPVPGMYAIVFIHAGEVRWTRRLQEIASAKRVEVATFKQKKPAELLAERLRGEP